MEHNSIDTFKFKLLSKIKEVGEISFSVLMHHKGHHVNLPDLGEFQIELEEWIAYSGLAEYLVSKDIYYEFSGVIYLEEDETIISVKFDGPYDEEFEKLVINIDNETLLEVIGTDTLKQPFNNYNSDEFFIQFEYDESQGFLSFSADYYDDNRWIDLKDVFVDGQIERLKKLCEQSVLSNLPTLDVPLELTQDWSASCDQNSVKYSITTGFLKIRFDDI